MLHERKSRLKEGRTALSSSEPELGPLRGRVGRVGAELRAARMQYGWELEAVAAALRIRAAYLQALEAGRIADLPGNAYALGFLRTYATALGLDADEMSRRFRAEVAEVNAKTELTFPAPVPERGVPAGAVIVLGVVLAIGAYVGWYRLTEHGAPAAQVPPVPPMLAHLAEPTVLAPKPVPAPAAQPATPAAQPAAAADVTFAATPVVTPRAPGADAPATVPQATMPAIAPAAPMP
ncbi:MAG: helix-turn-helix domain-containing protein, partial [Acetobacteraceae bacterium]